MSRSNTTRKRRSAAELLAEAQERLPKLAEKMQKADAKRANSPTGEARYVLAKYTYDQCVKTIERLQVQVLTDGLEPEVKREIATLKKAQAICTKYNAPEQISNALATIAAAIPGAQS